MPATAKTDDGTDGTEGSLPLIVVLGAGLAVAAGVVARFVAPSPMWLDEALSVNIASLPLGDIGDALRADGHPPLYYWLLHGWMSLAGDGDVAVRSLSAVFGVAALPLMWLVGRRVGGPVTGTWAMVLLALSPYAVRYSTEARMYSFVMVLVLAGAVLLPRAIRNPTPLRLAGVVVLTGALLWTHYWSIYLLGAVGGLLLWRMGRPGGLPAPRAGLVRVLTAMALGGLSFGPWVPSLLEQARHTGTPWALPARPAQVVTDTITDLGTGSGDPFAEGQLLGALLFALAVIGVLGVRTTGGATLLSAKTAPRVHAVAVVVVTTMAVGAVAGLFSGSAFSSRYAAVVVPLVLALAATGLTKLPSGWPATSAAVAVVALALAGTAKAQLTDRTEAAELAAQIGPAAGRGDVVVACPDQLGVSLDRALTQADVPLPVLPYPEIGDDPRFVDWREYGTRNDAADPVAVARAVDERAAGAVWVVFEGSYRTFEGDCEALVVALSNRRGAADFIGAVPDARAFEHADLLRFGSRA